MSSHTHTHTSLLVIFPTWPSTHPLDGHSVRSRKYRTTYTGHVRIFVFGRDHVWIKWRHGTPAGADIHRFYVVWLFLLFRQLVARSLARGREKAWRVCVCVCERVHVEGECGIPGMCLAIRSSILHWYVTCGADIGGNRVKLEILQLDVGWIAFFSPLLLVGSRN